MTSLKHVVTALGLALATAAFAGEPIDVNTATAEALAEAIPGVGMKKAAAIVAFRDANGPFRSIDDLTQVSGIGERTLERGRENLSVGMPSK